jgi:hypothetical protein
MVRVKPTEATAHNNILPSRSMASSNTATARKLGLEDNQDTVGRHQGTVKDHHREARQAATDNKLVTEVQHMAHQAALTAALQITITTSTTNMVGLLRMLISMAEANSILLFLGVTRLGMVDRQVPTRLSRAGSRFLAFRLDAVYEEKMHDAGYNISRIETSAAIWR